MTPTDSPALDATGRDLALEAELDDAHIVWVYEPDLALADIDISKSLANQARIGEPLIEDVVERYRADYERGDRFPPILCRRTGPRAKLIVLGGNHRRAAASAAGRTSHPAYIVECTDPAALTIMYGDNRRHGMPPSKLERCAQGAHLIDNGWTQAEAAAAVGVSQPSLSNYLNVSRTSRRARMLDLGPVFDQLPNQAKEALARVGADPVFVEAVKVTASAKLTGPETAELVKRIRGTRSEADALRLVGNAHEIHRDRIQNAKAKGRHGGKNSVTSYAKLNSALVEILDIPADTVVAPDPASGKRMRERLRVVLDRLVEIDKALKH